MHNSKSQDIDCIFYNKYNKISEWLKYIFYIFI